MLKRPITYTSWDGPEVTEDFYFNFTEAELIELEFSEEGGLHGLLNRIVQTNNNAALIAMFKKLVLAAYGVRSEDGRRFVKNEQLGLEFTQTPAYSVLFMELATDANKAADFVNGVMPAGLVKKAQAEAAKQDRPAPVPPTTR